MTTVCTDGRTIAADTLVTGGGMRHGFVTSKIHRLSDGSIVGHSGSAGQFPALIEWMEKHAHDVPFSTEWGMEALRLYPDGELWCYDKTGNRFRCTAPQAIGTGAAVAYGAMAAGADPIRAVEIACEIDIHTGGSVTSEGV